MRSAASGFTLIELLVASALAAIVTGLIAAALFQMTGTTTQATRRLALLSSITLASQALARDANSASVAVVSDAHHLTLTQPLASGGPPRTVTYSLAPPLLLRGDGAVQQTIARSLSAQSSFGPAGIITGTRLLQITLVAAEAGDTQSQTLQIGLRVAP